jgi:hypothetical protein
VPTDAQKQGDFSNLLNASGQQIAIYNPFVTSGQPRRQFSYNGTVNRIDPSLLNPVAKAIASYYPAPNLPGDPNTGLHNYFSSAATLYQRNNIGLRMDYYLTPTRQIAGRFTSDRTPSHFPQPYGADNIGTPGQSKTTYVRYSTFLSYSDAIKPNLLTEVRVGVNVFGIDRIPYSAGFDATKLGFPASLNANQHLPVFPYFTFSATSGLVIAVEANAPTYGGSRPNLVGDPRPSHATVSQWLNPAAFQTIPSYTFGNSPRNLPNYFTQPLVNLDSSISRTITFADRIKTEFRMEAFNTFNSTTFGSPGTTVGFNEFRCDLKLEDRDIAPHASVWIQGILLKQNPTPYFQ